MPEESGYKYCDTKLFILKDRWEEIYLEVVIEILIATRYKNV